jgi:predicted enzyme related to lactoylglutathione lyase
VAPAVDVMEAGRLAIVQDPQGAHLGLWQPRGRIGATLVNDPGAMTINQLNTTDPAGAARFYGDLFGWDFPQVSPDPQPYWSIHNAGRLNGGMMPLPDPSAPPHWLVYFTTADLDAAAAGVAAGLGQVVVPPMAIGAGRILVARDPQGAHFALFEGPYDP